MCSDLHYSLLAKHTVQLACQKIDSFCKICFWLPHSVELNSTYLQYRYCNKTKTRDAMFVTSLNTVNCLVFVSL